MLEQVLEGTWEEIAHHADELAGKRVRLTVVEEAPAAAYKKASNSRLIKAI